MSNSTWSWLTLSFKVHHHDENTFQRNQEEIYKKKNRNPVLVVVEILTKLPEVHISNKFYTVRYLILFKRKQLWVRSCLPLNKWIKNPYKSSSLHLNTASMWPNAAVYRLFHGSKNEKLISLWTVCLKNLLHATDSDTAIGLGFCDIAAVDVLRAWYNPRLPYFLDRIGNPIRGHRSSSRRESIAVLRLPWSFPRPGTQESFNEVMVGLLGSFSPPLGNSPSIHPKFPAPK